MNVKDEILFIYIFGSITTTILITGSAIDGLTLLIIVGGIWIISTEMIKWSNIIEIKELNLI